VRPAEQPPPRRTFSYSMLYLALLLGAMVVDALVR
jgi:heme O synthase-like polyprenyltransferase